MLALAGPWPAHFVTFPQLPHKLAAILQDAVAHEAAGWAATSARALIEGVPDGVLVLDGAGRITMHNQAAAAMFGVPAGDLLGEHPAGTWRFQDAEGTLLRPAENPLGTVAADGVPIVRHTVGISRPGGPVRWVHLRVRALGAVPGLGQAVAVVVQRATDPQADRSLATLGRDLGGDVDDDRQVVEGLFRQRSVGMVQCAPDGTVLRTNHAFAAMVGRTTAELVGTGLAGLIVHEDLARDRQVISRLLHGGADTYDAEVRLLHAEGRAITAQFGTSAVRDEDGRCTSVISMVVDLSRLRRAEHFMSSRALFDPLTQLVSRTLLIDLLADQLSASHRGLAVIALNLDRFRAVNDSLGQATGDGVLVEVAGRLRSVLRPGDAAARTAGDDFVLLLADVRTRPQGELLAQRILDEIAEPIDVEGLRIQLSASAGVSLIPEGAALTADAVMFQASAALAHAKQHGRARWTLFDEAVEEASTDRLRIETSLRTALGEGRLEVAYQPLMDLRTDRIVGAEALLRWTDPVLGPVAPATFLPVAEETGLIVPLGEFVLADAVAAVGSWRAGSRECTHVAVNLSPHELNRPGIADRIAEVLQSADLPPEALRLEITESVLVDADVHVRRNLADLHGMGVAIGIDDFGTGWSSMTYLRNLPVDFVKVDRSFVAGITTSHEDRAIVRAILDLARALQLGTVAEGIETLEQLEVLRELGCEVGQGYLIGRPAPVDHLHRRLDG